MDRWFKLPDFIRFIFVGGLNAFISYVIFVIAILILGKEHYQLCVALQWILSSFISYLNQKFLVFCTKGNYVKDDKCFIFSLDKKEKYNITAVLRIYNNCTSNQSNYVSNALFSTAP